MGPSAEGRDQPILSIVGERVALGPPGDHLLPLLLKWRNDFAVTRTLGTAWRLTSRDSAEAAYERLTRDEHTVAFLVHERESSRIIGFSALFDIDHFNRTAEFELVIGEKECWSKGYGTEATALTADYGFTWLGLHAIRLRVFSYHPRGIRAYTRAGFRVSGRWREAHRLGERAFDVVWMDCLATEFRSPVLHQYLPEG
jgi:RimJ/RimL family protein N-acetyltransferase